jgi:tRNA(Met) C34 N-acetyltransferase TmcA
MRPSRNGWTGILKSADYRAAPDDQQRQSKGKNKQQTVTAVARERIGFIWAVAHEDKLLAT